MVDERVVEESEYAVHDERSLKAADYYSCLDSTAAAAAALQFLLPVFNNTASFPIAPTSTRLSDSCHGDKQHQEEQQPDGKKDKNCTTHCTRSLCPSPHPSLSSSTQVCPNCVYAAIWFFFLFFFASVSLHLPPTLSISCLSLPLSLCLCLCVYVLLRSVFQCRILMVMTQGWCVSVHVHVSVCLLNARAILMISMVWLKGSKG